jgi:hypothetical protein
MPTATMAIKRPSGKSSGNNIEFELILFVRVTGLGYKCAIRQG